MSVRRHGARQRRRRSAFTLIEVMVSLGVMTVGAMAIIGLQQHAIRTNVHARQLSIATYVAELWIERFKQDARSWTDIGYPATAGEPTPAQVLQNTQYLNAVIANPGVFGPLPADPVLSPAFDYWGEPVPVPAPATPHHFCASYRTSWVWVGRALRVDVRVWWLREGVNATLPNDCNDDDTALNPGGAQFNNFHTVYMSTVVRATPLNQ